MNRNVEVASHLRTISQLLSLDGAGKFRVDAFENAARTIETRFEPIDQSSVSGIAGIGKSTAGVICEFLATGTSSRMEELGTRFPVRALTMTRVKGVGPVTAMRLAREGIDDFDVLVARAEAGTLMKGGQKDEAMIREVLYARDVGQGRIAHTVAKHIGEWAAKEVGKIRGVASVTVCGSVRRGAATSKDVDLIVLLKPGRDREAVVRGFLALGDPINSGSSKASAHLTRIGQVMQVDMWMVEEWHHGAALVYATGSKAHCISLRTRAQARGMTLNEYGLFPAKCQEFTKENSLAGCTESEVYCALGLKYIGPEKRSGNLES